jgi:hypothetical protein
VSLIGMGVTLVWLGTAFVVEMPPELMLLFVVLHIAAWTGRRVGASAVA